MLGWLRMYLGQETNQSSLTRRPAACAVEDVRDRITRGLKVLDISVRLFVWLARVVPTTVDLYDGEGRVRRAGAV